jgi:D-amino-acid dehydrogenase
MERRAVVVIGGGVIGVCSALYLAERGCAVTLLEKADICAGASYGNAGLVVPSHSIPLAAPGVISQALRWMLDPESPFYIRPRLDRDLIAWLWKFRAACTTRHVDRALPILRDLNYQSLALYGDLAGRVGFDFGFQKNGVLSVFRTAEAFRDAVHKARVLESAGVSVRVLDAEAARLLEPTLLQSIAGALYFPDDAHLVPGDFVRGLARVAEKTGAVFQTGTEVLGFATRGRHVVKVETTRGDLECDHVVLAAGPWSSALARGLGLRVPIQAAKGYAAIFRRPSVGPQIPLLLGEARAAVTPMGETLRIAGTLELAGLDLSIDRRRMNAVRRAAAGYVAGTDNLPVVQLWSGLRPCSPDGLPVIGRPKAFDNLVVATGHATIGMSLGPITGTLVAQLVTGETPAVDVALLNPDRF